MQLNDADAIAEKKVPKKDDKNIDKVLLKLRG